MTQLTSSYWNDRYAQGNFPWDAGAPTTPFVEYIDQLTDKSLRILIPGAGSAHEGGYLHAQGFTNVHILDWSQNALDRFQKKQPDFPAEHLICSDFFEHEGEYDLILEQTFFCALNPELRDKWVKKMSQLLARNGKVVGVMFDFPLTDQGPPFGGSSKEYKTRFEPLFEIKCLELCYNSIKPRAGSELFVMLQKK